MFFALVSFGDLETCCEKYQPNQCHSDLIGSYLKSLTFTFNIIDYALERSMAFCTYWLKFSVFS